MKNASRGFLVAGIVLVVLLVLGQVITYLISAEGWSTFASRLPEIITMLTFWGPIIALLAGLFVWVTLRLLGFNSLEEIRLESVEQNNPTPAIVFVGTLIAAILFLMLVIRP
jgi:hypothetical protein